MYTDEELQSAVQAGILDAEAVAALRAHVEGLRNGPMVDEENFRLVSGFNDIFVALACVLVLGSIATLAALQGGTIAAALAVSAVSWFLAEPFTRKRRLALPSILLALSFAGGISLAAVNLLDPFTADHPDSTGMMGFLGGVYGGLAAGGLAAWVHWKRFRVPVDVAFGVAGIVWCVRWGFSLVLPPESAAWMPITLAMGVAVFATALRWDRQDPLRRTRKSDVAFWIHLIAAPLLISPLFSMLGIPSLDESTNVWQALGALAVYFVLIVVSLLVDRRALLVSGLVYVLIAVGMLLGQRGYSTNAFMVMGLVLGSALLALSAYWHPARALVMRYAPARLRERVTPLRDVP
jgi:hypothetical protein